MSDDAIFLVQHDGKLVRMEHGPYESEDLLQTLLAEYPDLLAGYQITPQSPRRWLLVDREVGLAHESGGAVRWSVDHLFIDQDGIPTIVEVKRASDTRIRREVVGQMLDYAANGVVNWPAESLRSVFDAACGRRGLLPDAVMIDHLAGTEMDPEEFWDRVGENLRAGKVRLVFVADEIPTELRRIVEFLNVQMRPAQVIAVELRQYVGHHDEHELRTLVPRVIGMSEAAIIGKGQTPGRTYKEVAKKLFAWAERKNLPTPTLKSTRTVALPNGRAILWYYPKDAAIQFDFDSLEKAGYVDDVATLRGDLAKIVGKPTAPKYPWVPCDALRRGWEEAENHLLPAYVAAHLNAVGLHALATTMLDKRGFENPVQPAQPPE
jgi:hypothetical protein